jgi:hypothetical protein
MRASITTLIGTGAVVAALTGCSAGNSPLCTNVPLRNVSIPQMVYPVPQYAYVPVDSGAMVVAYNAAPALAQTITLTADGRTPVALGPLGAAPKSIPSPHAKPAPGSGALYGVTMPTLLPKTHYSVAYRWAATAGLCGTSTTQTASMGDFTTQ